MKNKTYCIFNEHPEEAINKYVKYINKYPNIELIDAQKENIHELENLVENSILIHLHSTSNINMYLEKILVLVIGKDLPENMFSPSYDYYLSEDNSKSIDVLEECKILDKKLRIALNVFYGACGMNPNSFVLKLRNPSYYKNEMKKYIPNHSFFEKDNKDITVEFFTSLENEEILYKIKYIIPLNKFLEELSIQSRQDI